MKIKIYTEEWFPVYQIDDNPNAYGEEVEVDDSEFQELNSLQLQANQLHYRLQRKLEKLLGS